MAKFYAVKNGRKVGIFSTWEECQKQVVGFKGAIYKSFKTKEEAEACIALAQLCQLRDRYNDGWKPNWNKETDKYTIIYSSDKIDTSFSVYSQRILSFKTVELRDKFLENFRGLIETAKPLL